MPLVGGFIFLQTLCCFMTIPVTVDDGVARIPETYLDDMDIPTESPRIPVTPDVLQKHSLNFSNRDKWFTEGAFVAIKYEIHDELQYSSAYVLTSAYETTDDLWKIFLKPTHGRASSLNGKQAYKFDNKLVLRRNLDKVRGGAKMILAPIDPEHIMKAVGGETQVVAHTI